jgi:hypothetical protein
MKKLEIEIPQGHEIDQEKSDLSKGLVVFKKVEEKWPTSWEDLGKLIGYLVTSDSLIRKHNQVSNCDLDKNTFPTKQL